MDDGDELGPRDRSEGTDAGAGGDPVEAAREEVIGALARSAEIYGVKRSYGRLYGLLYFADGPVSLDELVDRSGYAKSTVSTAMNALERFHFVHRRSLPGEGKKAFFEAERDFWHIFRELARQEGRREIRTMTRALDAAEEKLHDTEDPRAEQDLERIRQLQSVYGQFERFVEVIGSQRIERIMEAFGRLQRD